MQQPLFTTKLPRRDLKESAFRKYEADIARACKESYAKRPDGMSATTYMARFRDAILGFTRYNYVSTLITCNKVDLMSIKLDELSDGSVWIYNPIAEAVDRQLNELSVNCSDHDAVRRKAELLTNGGISTIFEIVTAGQDDIDFLKLLQLSYPNLSIQPSDTKANVYDMC